jgi:hypothetical protein
LVPLVAALVVAMVTLVVVTMTSSQSAWGPTAGLPRAAAEVKPPALAPAPRPTTPKPPKHAPPAKYACPGFSGIEKPNPVGMLYQDTFVWSTFPAFQVGNGKGNINWRADPYDNPSWYMWMHSLRWLGQGVRAAESGDRKALTRVTTIIHDWIRDNPYDWKVDVGAHEATMHRTNVLLCLRLAVLSGLKVTKLPQDYAWLGKSLLEHAKFMRLNWSGVGNHGTDESIAMRGIGCTLGRSDLKNLAQQRLSEATTTAIDKQGSTNEQATGYAQFNYGLWGRAAKALKDCGVRPRYNDHGAPRAAGDMAHPRHRLVRPAPPDRRLRDGENAGRARYAVRVRRNAWRQGGSAEATGGDLQGRVRVRPDRLG